MLSNLSLSAKINIAATLLVVVSLAVTATVIGFKSSRNAEDNAMNLARTQTAAAASALQSRIARNLAAIIQLGATQRATRAANLPLSREQTGEITKATLLGSDDLIGAAVTWEPNALDDKDADYADKKPEYDASGRYMPYYTRAPSGGINVEPIVFDPKPGANDWYDIPKRTGKVFFTEPYAY